MAQIFTTIFGWIKMIFLFKAVVPDCKDPNRSSSESPSSSTSTAEPLPPEEFILDIEVLHSQQSSSPASISSNPTTPTSQSLSSLSSPRSTDPSRAITQSREEDISNEHNLIDQVFQELDLGKVIITFVMTMTAPLLSLYAPTSGPVRNLIFSSLALGLGALWNGILLHRVLTRHAITIEQIGAGLVLVAYCGLISSFLPDYLVWIPWFCFLLELIPFFWSHYLDRVAP